MEQTRTFELAGIGERFVALFIDGIVLSVIGGIVGAGGAGFDGGGLVGFIIGVGYHWYFLTQQNGQTPGKMVMNIRVIKTNGQPISDGDALLRYVGYYINTAIIMLGWIWAFIDGKSQGLHDKLASTYVIKARNNDNVKIKNDDVIVG